MRKIVIAIAVRNKGEAVILSEYEPIAIKMLPNSSLFAYRITKNRE
jgi:hypothetical protein